MEPRRPKWSRGGANEAQDAQGAQMEPRRLKWNPGGPNEAQEALGAQMEPRRPKSRKSLKVLADNNEFQLLW